jgi:geranylgeranyl pyrophosphate synthase
MNKQDPNTQLQKLFKQKGTKPLKAAKQTILKERIESREVKEALHYFMTECWHDVARPGVLALVSESLGGRPEDTTKVAIPLILIGGATDIHDDIIDESKTKYDKPTVYGKFGKNIAILAGDALFFKGLTMLNRTVADHLEINDTIKNMFFELGDAEALELQLRKKLSINPEEYLNIIRKKAADVEAHTRIAAIITGATKKEVKTLGKYGRMLGMLIILKDDYIDSLEYEELEHRIQNEHFPMPMLYALTEPETNTAVAKIQRKRNITRKDIQMLKILIRKAKGYQKTAQLMNDLIKTAEKQITTTARKSYLQLMLDATRV